MFQFCDPMDYSLPGSSVYGILQGKNTGVGCRFLLQGIFPTQGVSPGLPVFQTDSVLSEWPGKPPNLINSHWTANTHTRGKLGKGDAGLMPSIQKHIKSPSAMVETYSRSTMEQTAEMVNVGQMWGPGRGGLGSRVKQQEALLSFTAFLPFGIALSLTAYQYPAHFLASPQTHSPMKPSCTHLSSCWVAKALISHLSWRTILFCSIICTCAHGFSQLLWGKICAWSSVLDPDAHYL